jgi:hypothetical protein
LRRDVLLVKLECDEVIPGSGISNYLTALGRVRSLTYRVIADADHALSEQPWQQSYASLLLGWANEMVIAAREDGVAPEAGIGWHPLCGVTMTTRLSVPDNQLQPALHPVIACSGSVLARCPSWW